MRSSSLRLPQRCSCDSCSAGGGRLPRFAGRSSRLRHRSRPDRPRGPQTIIGLLISENVAEAINWLVLAAVLAVPISFLYGLTRSRFGATTRRLVAELSQKREPEQVQEVLRAALRDPTLELGYLGPTATSTSTARRSSRTRVPIMTTRVGDESSSTTRRSPTSRSSEPPSTRRTSRSSAVCRCARSRRANGARPRSSTRFPTACTASRATELSRVPAQRDRPSPFRRPARGHDDRRHPRAGRGRGGEARDGPRARGGSTELVEYSIEQPEQRDVESATSRRGSCGAAPTKSSRSCATSRSESGRKGARVATEQPEILFDIVTRARRSDACSAARTRRTSCASPDSTEGQIVGNGRAGNRDRRARTHGDHGRRTAHPRPSHGEACPRRIDDPDIGPRLRQRLIELGVTSVVAAPIEVSGELWGRSSSPSPATRRFPREPRSGSRSSLRSSPSRSRTPKRSRRSRRSPRSRPPSAASPSRSRPRSRTGSSTWSRRRWRSTRRGRRQPDPLRPAQRA